VHFLGQGLLVGGVTTVRDLGAPLDVLPLPDHVPGRLRVLAAGPLVTVPGGYPSPVHGAAIALNVRGPADARTAVRTLARRGAAIVKVSLEPGTMYGPGWPILSAAELGALVDEAHARGLKVTAHAQGVGVRRALDAGVDELAHMPCGQAPAALVREVARRRIPIVGTLHVYGGGCGQNAREFVRAGGKLLYGSDFGNPGIPSGIDVEELELMAHAGLSRLAVLRAATSEAGRQLDWHRSGRSSRVPLPTSSVCAAIRFVTSPR
jgi:imidazolonepropionase-like amidohydrolase